jgi:toll-interacting protein
MHSNFFKKSTLKYRYYEDFSSPCQNANISYSSLPVGGTPVYTTGQPPPQQQPTQQGPMYTDDDVNQIKEMFPDVEDQVIKSILESHRGNKDATINDLLSM